MTRAGVLLVTVFAHGTALALPPTLLRAREVAMTDTVGFSVGPPVALTGGDGQALAASGSRIATFGASRATWWVGGTHRSVALPNVPVHGARWSADGAMLLAGTGMVDLARGTWTAHPAFDSLAQQGSPEAGSFELKVTSWSADRRHAAALLGWSGPSPQGGAPATRVVVLDLTGASAGVDIVADDASDVQIVADRVVVAAPVVRVWTFAGAQVAALPATPGTPHALRAGDSGPLFVVDANGSIRVVNPATWSVQAVWDGPLLDAVAVPGGGLVALDAEGRLHAGCLSGDRVRQLGIVDSGVRASRLAVTGDGRLVLQGGRPIPVATMTYRLSCGTGR